MAILKKLSLSVDGACKGNPGSAGIGVVINDESGKEIAAIGEYIGDATNNIAEYTALLRGLRECIRLGADAVIIQTDSELMAKQLLGEYKVKAAHLQPLYLEAKRLLGQFKLAKIKYVPREENKRADELASAAASSRNGTSSIQN
jgi:ribonuclease HI